MLLASSSRSRVSQNRPSSLTLSSIPAAYCVLVKRAPLALALYCFLLARDSYPQMTLRALNAKRWHCESPHLGSEGGVF